MTTSILTSTKKVLGLADGYTPFDEDVIMGINSAFSVLNQLGVGPPNGFFIEDSNPTWDDYTVPVVQLQLVRTYVFLKTRLGFDPPTTSYLITAMTEQISEYEWRLTSFAESLIPLPTEEVNT